MRQYLGNYKPVYTPTFEDQISTVSERMKQRIQSRIDNLIQDPYHNTEFMKGLRYKGKRKLRINRKDRLVFVICEECRSQGHTSFNLCGDCDSTPENAIVIAFIIFDHNY